MIYQPYPMKRCVTCNTYQPFVAFHRNKTKSDGLQNKCKRCMKQYVRDNPDKIREKNERWKFNNIERRRDFERRYYIEHKERIDERIRQWSICHRDRRCAISARYAKSHPEKIKEMRRSWGIAFPHKMNEYQRNRRARIKKAEGKHTAQDVIRQYNAQGGLCYWCSTPLLPKWHADHVIPLNRGGSNWPNNIVCACPTCNISKSDNLPFDEWTPPNPLHPR